MQSIFVTGSIFLVILSAYYTVLFFTALIPLLQLIINMWNTRKEEVAYKKEELRILKASIQRDEKYKNNGFMFDYEEDILPTVDEFPYVEESDPMSLYEVESSK